MSDDDGDLPPDELQERRDRAVKPKGFRAWILRGPNADGDRDPRWEPLRKAMLKDAHGGTPSVSKFPPRFDREVYAKALNYDEDLLELLTQAEMEWRVDNVARGNLDKKLEIDTSSALDFHDPAQGQAQFCRFQLNHGNGTKKFCRVTAVPGTVRCKAHGGELVNEQTRRAVLMSSYLQIVEATAIAVECLVDVTLNSRNDLARVQASREILDRAGLTAELNVTVRLDDGQGTERMDKLREKLDSMQRGLMHQVIEATSSHD